MVAKSEIKFIKSLQLKKNRMQHGLFVAEGVKMVQDLLDSGLRVHSVYATEEGIFSGTQEEITLISASDLKRMSSLRSPNKGLAVFYMHGEDSPGYEGWNIVLDDVQDPGNLGTIIRLCDWFGIRNLVCSRETVDCYNPKVLQATMGSIARVNISYTDLSEYLAAANCPVYGSYMAATPVYSSEFNANGILVMGNEAHGISENVARFLTDKISIPSAPGSGAESLNVATATAILLYELKRP
ncbi:RNA methyltransferase [Zeaxanthinibacter sp. PT1]|uniref:RNA methyltransferase n=1 Tax=Zeaxanthinibacter TaxID=561554 RepID=UPI0023491506|nr:RNA methyltransferase [Zeaxanthinibacter sp. PT1]MDC6349948.1 RNA methyltransferase [Zeaxanthinibacter sp. PT1]